MLEKNKRIDFENNIEIQKLKHEHELDIKALTLSKQFDSALQFQSHILRLIEAQEHYQKQIELRQDENFDARVWPLRTPLIEYRTAPIMPQIMKSKYPVLRKNPYFPKLWRKAA